MLVKSYLLMLVTSHLYTAKRAGSRRVLARIPSEPVSGRRRPRRVRARGVMDGASERRRGGLTKSHEP